MKKHVMLIPIALLMTGCGTINHLHCLVTSSTEAINANTDAVEYSTCVINENARVVSASTQVVEQNRTQLQSLKE